MTSDHEPIALPPDALSHLEPIETEIKPWLNERFAIHHSTLESGIAGQSCCEHDRTLIPATGKPNAMITESLRGRGT